ncbi:MAG: hypothetical protein FWF96_07485, partial [Kiritimatiellaeota bacterium]|nr:hypothetical protein [Kiritimatiellota bacterium]
LQAARPGLCFTGEAFAREPGLQPRDEIRRVLSAAPGGMTLHALLVQLPYLPPMVVEETLVGDPDFTRGKPGRATKWSLARAVAITPEDCEALRAELDTRLKNAEWVPAAGFDLSAIAARNPGVPAETLRARLLREALGMEYQVRRGVITRKGLALRPRQAIAALCRARETLTRDDLNEMAQQIYGRRSVPCLDVPGGRMVRVTADLFVAERLVPFDTPGTDAALEALCPGDYIPACAVRDFSTFHAVNYPWTHALLESYCRRHSRVFSFATFGWNIQSVGVILRKSSPLKKYRDILADALARSGLRFSDAAAAHQYLKQEGYVLNRMPLLLPKIFSAEK